jgi:diguanylate cyclase (GGDEF)-like protein
MSRHGAIRRSVLAFVLVAGVGAAFVHLGNRHRALEDQVRQQQRVLAATRELDERLRLPEDAALPIRGWVGDVLSSSKEAGPVHLTSAGLERWQATRRSQPEHATQVSGPYRTTDGRWAVVAPLPRQGGNAQGSDGAVVLISDLLSAAKIPDLVRQGFDFEVSAVDAVSGRRQIVARSSEFELRAPTVQTISTARNEWILAVSSRAPSIWRRGDAWLAVLITIMAGLGVALVTYEASTYTVHLRQELEKQARRLSEVNQRVMDEVQQREDIEEQFAHASFHDTLTGLPNRRYFATRVDRALHRMRRQPGTAIAVLIVGFDRFRIINETFGFAAGDELLKEAVRRIEECTKGAELALSRGNGDEFALLLPELSSADDAVTLARRLQDALAQPVQISGETVFTTASVGVAVRVTGYARADEVVQEADIALSRAKAEGRARHALFDASAREEVIRRQQLETDLHHALQEDHFRLFFQPIVALDTGRIVGMEALVRWEHPRKGLVAPGEFITTAEHLGLIVPINRWVMRHAALQLRDWRRRLPHLEVYVSTNLSAHDLKEADLCDHVEGVLRETGLPRGALRLEVTESALIEDVKGANEFLAGFRRIGVPVLLDDFGTGYSSLGYLNQFRVDYLKIDRAFVRRVSPSGGDGRILKAIVHLAQDLDIATVAEGIETAEELNALVELHCLYGQGYYFSKPVPAARMEGLLVTEPFLAHGRVEAASARRAPVAG